MKNREDNGNQLKLDYKLSDYERPSVTADILVFSVKERSLEGMKLLLIRRKHDPFGGCLALPGGFVNPDETVDHAAMRELEEETALKGLKLIQLRTFSKPGRDPRGWVITQTFIAAVEGEPYSVRAGDDAKDAEWYEIKMDLISEENAEQVYRLIIGEEKDNIHAEASVTAEGDIFKGKKCVDIIDSEGLAFDHAEMIFYGVLEMKRTLKN
ncbi:Bifunctional NMN adenylyltransferase/Nudix hydrolase [uncultured Roseburia sp.]|uniref:NUDIX hydrolase n=1 Tax=Brotonthovivens ammoniilytica TaxID=2981725 RepID=A0ABT2TLY8_9FIRM|nr:NUDIX hydrolase [Brotonthovivens ammoniilytica]MCU6763237.1 NUDIX hydrolase [Brotonthovivens ammoniilytica]SCJ10367.1 Bifunctional NMN adenylyltransferase/Nudix hydrolase [uncultured Roseburia sp.]